EKIFWKRKSEDDAAKILPVEYDRYLTNSWHAYYRISMAYRKNKQYLHFVYYQIRSFLCHPILYFKRLKEIF
ncbi:MAG TPA: hypothetical protein P5084_05985, partial [Paludibacter sp.]|nr:hypothetical protein [Paludibacter sp.]